MLLPTTSIIVWWLRRPETAEKRERSIWVSLGMWVVRRQPAELDELAELDYVVVPAVGAPAALISDTAASGTSADPIVRTGPPAVSRRESTTPCSVRSPEV